MNKFGIYIHIPFCVKKCDYCDFISYANKEEMVEEYINALLSEIEYYGKKYSARTITSIYIGGGTPSFINEKYIVDIINKIKNCYNVNLNQIEVTIEVNPGTVNKSKLQTYLECGINRLSIGLQSTHNNLLKEIGRIHSYEEFEKTYSLAREVGFKNINVDLMLALPKQTVEMLEESVNTVLKLNPEHISIYSLIIEENTAFWNKYNLGELDIPNDDEERKMYWSVTNLLKETGYNHYEISNYAKKGYEAKHNMDCWNQEEYIGFGVAAHSYINKLRYSKIVNLRKYIDNIKNSEYNKNIIIEEEQTKEDEQKEFMMLGLRKIDGINISEFKNKFVQNPIYIYRKELEEFVNDDLLEVDTDNIKLTKRGIDFANVVWEKFC